MKRKGTVLPTILIAISVIGVLFLRNFEPAYVIAGGAILAVTALVVIRDVVTARLWVYGCTMLALLIFLVGVYLTGIRSEHWYFIMGCYFTGVAIYIVVVVVGSVIKGIKKLFH